ncbi:MAG: hypothetical protein WBL62_08450 [Gallionella sp.]
MTENLTQTVTEANYNQFIIELTLLTRKHGIAIKSVGGVVIANQLSEFANASYDADFSSGDIYPINIS